MAVVSLAFYLEWYDLKSTEDEQFARLTEAESYAARAQLVQNFDTLLGALQNAHIFWSRFGGLPREEWGDDASMELSHLQGVELIMWYDPDKSLRYVRKVGDPVSGYRPSDEEWATYNDLVARSHGLTQDQITGPIIRDDGTIQMHIFFTPRANQTVGYLIAVMDITKALDSLLAEESPGYVIEVSVGDTVVYRRGALNDQIPEDLRRKGKIRNSLGGIFEVTHSPTPELIRALHAPAVNAFLYTGIIIAVLMALLLAETDRSRRRARAARTAEAETRVLNLDLEQQVAERTRELQERSRDLVTITDSVGHDLRNPLNSISANVQLLDQQYQEQLGDSGVKILGKMSSGVVQMTEILDRLLSLSTVANVDFERERIDLTEMVEETFEELQESEPDPPVDFFAEEVPDVMGEPMMIQVLILNLLSNALKYTRAKQDRKVIFSWKQIDGQPVYYLQDNGIGFSSELSEKLFEAFERLHDDDETEGLGLGLDIANRVVRRHNGKIWAEGAPGNGATFYFTLGEEGVVDENRLD